ncbi:hypothetical protein N0V84_003681 [Fusarium piperis]|uniref:C3H1-type domain-containing protein n=1 Tax=Fusarium piperis TaxID=1435070 RepID=A0A9W8WGY5_9HYPO|nr:hypothetical protein N0V84_003681 [Fusarium piperis]
MTVCRFFQQGNCKFGNNCRNEHPNPNNNRNQTSNRFGALGGGANNIADKYSITAEAIERDLTNETPQWILSAYAPGRDAPGQLFGGFPREQSFEELRLHYVMGKASGNEQQALNQAQELWTNAQQQMQNAVRNTQEAVQFIISAENNHPNRQDICRERTQGNPFGEFIVGKRPKSMLDVFSGQPHNQTSSATPNTSSPFGGRQSAFGQPSALGAKPSPFGAPAFGQPSQPNAQGSAFGQPSQPAQGGSAFGQPSQLGQGGSAFGQPSQPTPAFGQPSQPASAFGQASQPTSAFGQASTLGAKPSPFGAPAFGQPSQPGAQGSAFGQASQLGQQPSPFGATTNTNNNASPFASAGNNNSAPAANNPFGAPSGGFANNQNSSPFGGANNQQADSGFSSFGKPSQGASPFGQQQQQNPPATSNAFASANQAPAQNANNPFGQPSQPQPNGFASQNNQQANNPFGQPSQPNPFGQPSAAPAGANPFASAQSQAPKPAAAAFSGSPYPPNSSRQHPPVESYSSKGMDGRLSMFRGKPVTYKDNLPGIRDFDGTWRRIWFPDGPPGYSKDTELPPEQYDDKSKAQWMAFAQKGEFEGGVMPELPPPRECTVWNF